MLTLMSVHQIHVLTVYAMISLVYIIAHVLPDGLVSIVILILTNVSQVHALMEAHVLMAWLNGHVRVPQVLLD